MPSDRCYWPSNMGKKRIIAETGLDSVGVATATVCALMNMQCIVYIGKTDVERQHIVPEKMKCTGPKSARSSGSMTQKDATKQSHPRLVLPPCVYLLYHRLYHEALSPYPDMVARLQSVISEEIKQLKEQEEGNIPIT